MLLPNVSPKMFPFGTLAPRNSHVFAAVCGGCSVELNGVPGSRPHVSKPENELPIATVRVESMEPVSFLKSTIQGTLNSPELSVKDWFAEVRSTKPQLPPPPAPIRGSSGTASALVVRAESAMSAHKTNK